jgi:hypothetical protein
LDDADDPAEDDNPLPSPRKQDVSPVISSSMLMIVKWEIAALKRTGGYNARENNLFHPDQAEKNAREEEDNTLPNESYQSSLPRPVDVVEYRKMCKLHSVSCRTGFSDTINDLSSTIFKSVTEYKQTYTYDKLVQGAITKKFASGNEILAVHQDMAMIETALEEKKLMEWGDLEFEIPLSCKGTTLKIKITNI